MDMHLKYSGWARNLLIITSIVAGVLISFWLIFEKGSKNAEVDFAIKEIKEVPGELGFVQGNSVLSLVQPNNPEPAVVRKMKVVITGYSSSIWETDESPFITAAGTKVKDGIIANNFLI